MYHFVLWCTFRDFAVTLSFLDCYRWFSHILNDTLRSVPSKEQKIKENEMKKAISGQLGGSVDEGEKMGQIGVLSTTLGDI